MRSCCSDAVAENLPTNFEILYCTKVKVKISRNRPRWPKGFQVGRQPYAPATFTPGEIIYCFTAADIAQPVKLANPVASNIMGTKAKSREKYLCGPHYK